MLPALTDRGVVIIGRDVTRVAGTASVGSGPDIKVGPDKRQTKTPWGMLHEVRATVHLLVVKLDACMTDSTADDCVCNM